AAQLLRGRCSRSCAACRAGAAGSGSGVLAAGASGAGARDGAWLDRHHWGRPACASHLNDQHRLAPTPDGVIAYRRAPCREPLAASCKSGLPGWFPWWTGCDTRARVPRPGAGRERQRWRAHHGWRSVAAPGWATYEMRRLRVPGPEGPGRSVQKGGADIGCPNSQNGGFACRASQVVAAALCVAAALSGCLALVWNDAFVSSAFKSGVPLSPDADRLLRVTRVVLFGLSLGFLVGGFLVLARRDVVEGFRARHRKRIDDLLTALVTIVLLLVLLEVAARVVTGRQTSELGGAAYRAQLARIPLNSFGLRDREFPVDKPPGIVRILVLGDSFTFGHGIENESAPWPRVLETILNRDTPADTVYQVITTAHNGFGTAEELTALRASLVFHPALVILGYFFNDAETDEMILHPPSLTTVQRLLYGVHFALFSHSYLYGLAVVRWDILK